MVDSARKKVGAVDSKFSSDFGAETLLENCLLLSFVSAGSVFSVSAVPSVAIK